MLLHCWSLPCESFPIWKMHLSVLRGWLTHGSGTVWALTANSSAEITQQVLWSKRLSHFHHRASGGYLHSSFAQGNADTAVPAWNLHTENLIYVCLQSAHAGEHFLFPLWIKYREALTDESGIQKTDSEASKLTDTTKFLTSLAWIEKSIETNRFILKCSNSKDAISQGYFEYL